MSPIRKIINDPVYGFITIDHPLILQIISHPFYQRLRNINQMAFAHLVYPGAVRFCAGVSPASYSDFAGSAPPNLREFPALAAGIQRKVGVGELVGSWSVSRRRR